MRIPDDLLTCSVFLGGRDAGGRLHYRASAFLISMPTKASRDGAVCLVTARHNILKTQREYQNVWVRINTPDGEAVDEEITAPWEYPDYGGVDIAVVPFRPQFPYAAFPIPVRWFLADEVVEQRKVGIGEELFIIGLFSKHVGASRNLPIVRSGNIASMPQESLIDDASGDEFRAYLAEVRSIGGLSGSPVFVALNPFVRMHEEVGVIDGGGAKDELEIEAFYLLGLVRGHWHTSMESDYGESESDRLNTGIAMVTPITEILPLLEKEAFVTQRKEIDKKASAESGMVQDWDPETGEPSEFDRFEDLTRKLANVPKKELDEKRKAEG